jgi:cobalamin biosynthesis Mg chelatase CobN
VEVILGTFGARGKLPVNVPVFDNGNKTYTGEIKYARGYGLTYSAKSHVHSFSDDWSINTTHHWHDAVCGHDLVADKAEHTLDANGVCTVCHAQIAQPTKPKETEPQATEPTKTEPIVTEPTQTEPVESKPVETESIETAPQETEPVVTNPVETKPQETEKTTQKPTEKPGSSDNIHTGDSFSIAWLVVLTVSALATTALIAKRKSLF